MTSKTLICDTEHAVAILQDLGGDSVVVTFNESASALDGLHFGGDDLFLKQGISAIGIVTPGPNWFPPEAMDEVIGAVIEKIHGRKVVTYGHGQGGYGALKFSARLKAAAALSFCPQWSINPADVGSFDSRYTSYFDEALGNGLRIEQEDLCDSAFVFFDGMHKLDTANAAKLAALRGVKRILVPFSMHDTVRFVKEGGSAQELIGLCMREAPPDVWDLRRAIRASRARSGTYSKNMLRQLILRMGRFRSRPSIFVSRLVAKNYNDNPFYSALISHAKGNVSQALTELAGASPKNFKRSDLTLLWKMSNELRFDEAELAVAGQICRKLADNTFACLNAVSTLIRVGDLEGAHAELARLAKQGEAVNHIGHFVEFSLKLGAPDVMEAFLQDSLPPSTRIAVLYRLVDFYQRLGDRQSAFHHLMSLTKSCTDSPANLRRISNLFAEIGEASFALDIRLRLLKYTPRDVSLALDVVDARIPPRTEQIRLRTRRNDKALSELNQIISEPDLPPWVWERASDLYLKLGEIDVALRLIRKAVDVGAGPKARHRLAVLLAQIGRVRGAKRELAVLLAECSRDPRRLRVMGDFAVDLKDRRLAQRFAEAQFQCDPTNPDCILYLAHQTRMSGDLPRAQHMLCALFDGERRSSSISDEQWVRLAQELYDADEIAVAKEAVAEAVARKPNSAAVRKIAASIALLNKFDRPDSSMIPPRRASRKAGPGVISRLTRIFRP